MFDGIYKMIELTTDNEKRVLSPKLIFNENYLLGLILYWFSAQERLIINSDLDRKICKAFQSIDNARFYLNATIETPFKVRNKGEKDALAEASSTVSAVLGHFSILYGKKKERLTLKEDAKQFILLETTIDKPLKKGIKNFKKYHQVARAIGCMVQTLDHLENKFLDYLGLYIIAPKEMLKLESFKTYTYKPALEELIEGRIKIYGEDKEKQEFLTFFKRIFQRIDVDCISYEDILRFVKKNDSEYGDILTVFYEKTLRYHGLESR